MPGLGIGWSEKLVCLPSWWFTRTDEGPGCDGVVGLGGHTSHRSSLWLLLPRSPLNPGHLAELGILQ